ncbi:MAG: metallophosphoesterase [Verrucomicrobiae bacterium]|nr:metallophosphoesterase [Verrucomicrobiae bacterium]
MTTPRSAVIVWRTSRPITPWIAIRNSPNSATAQTIVQADQIVIRVSSDVSAPPAVARLVGAPEQTYQYEAHVSGLAPDTVYFYMILDLLDLVAGGDSQHWFRTAPASHSSRPQRFWFAGDTGDGTPAQFAGYRGLYHFLENEPSAEQRALDGYIHLGDMAYGTMGQGRGGTDANFSDNFFGVYGDLMKHTVTWTTMGNHEAYESDGVTASGPYYDAFVLPAQGEAGGIPSGTEAYYSFDVGDVHFVCLESNDQDRTPDGIMAQWLKSDLEQTNARWLVAFWHHPPYTKGSYDSDNTEFNPDMEELRMHIMPILESAGVDLVLCGHSHAYERSMLIDSAYTTPTTAVETVLDDGDGAPGGDGAYRKNAGLAPNNGTVAIVAGHGRGAEPRLHSYGIMDIMHKTLPVTGSVLVDFDSDTLTGRMLDEFGAVRDSFTISKLHKVEPASITHPWSPTGGPKIKITSVSGGSEVAIDPGISAPDAEIRYTLDNSAPDRDSLAYTAPFFLSGERAHVVSAATIWRDGGRISPATSRNILLAALPPFRVEPFATQIGSTADIFEELTEGFSALRESLFLGEGQLTALRFSEFPLPPGATILHSYLRFTVGVEDDRFVEFNIAAEKSLDAAAGTNGPPSISARPLTDAMVKWSPPAWTWIYDPHGASTPDLSSILQEVVDQPDWEAGNAIAFIITGRGTREAARTPSPELVVQYDSRSVVELATSTAMLEARLADFENTPVVELSYRAFTPGGIDHFDYILEVSATLSGGWERIHVSLPVDTVQELGSMWKKVTARIPLSQIDSSNRYFRLHLLQR